MKNQISLKKFIETFPLESFCKVSGNIPSNFKDLPYSEKYALFKSHLINEFRTVLSVTEDHIYYGEYGRTIDRKGRRIFPTRSSVINCIWIEKNSIKISGSNKLNTILEFLKLIGKDKLFVGFPNNVLNIYLIKPSVFRAVITNKIYNEETFYKFIGSRIFGLKNISWRTIKTYCLRDFGISIFDLRDFTKNVTESIDVLDKTNNLALYRDLIMYAYKLDQIVDFTWSLKRINEEHQKQIKTAFQKEILNKEQVSIYNNVISEENVKMLNTELDIFLESQNMHHCLYNCYYNRIKEHSYIAFHMNYPEDCTFSVCKDKNSEVCFDQIYLKYDRPVQRFTRSVAESFIAKHKDEILKCFKESVKTKESNSLSFQLNHLFDRDVDIPF